MNGRSPVHFIVVPLVRLSAKLSLPVCSAYRKSLNTSRALNRGEASNTSQGSDLIVLLEAGP